MRDLPRLASIVEWIEMGILLITAPRSALM